MSNPYELSDKNEEELSRITASIRQDAYRAGYSAGLNDGNNREYWISIDEMLPMPQSWVIVWIAEDGNEYAWNERWNGKYFERELHFDHEEVQINPDPYVTHWMPMPAKPNPPSKWNMAEKG